MNDAHKEAGQGRWTEASNALGATELLYADDAMLIGSTKSAINKLLHAIENQSSRYGMKLNKNKCEAIKINTSASIQFADSSHMKTVKHATYLGASICPAGYKMEIESRMQKANQALYRLKKFWRNNHCDQTWKLQVFNACVISIVTYGLEGIVLTKATQQRLDYFHTKCIRNILKIPTAYMSRISNLEVIHKANQILHGRDPKNQGRYQILSSIIRKKGPWVS